MTYWQKFTLLNKRIRGVIYSAIAVLIYATAGFFIVPLVLKPVVIDTLTEKLERQAQLEAIDCHLLRFFEYTKRTNKY
jgi:hypothetical protein